MLVRAGCKSSCPSGVLNRGLTRFQVLVRLTSILTIHPVPYVNILISHVVCVVLSSSLIPEETIRGKQ